MRYYWLLLVLGLHGCKKSDPVPAAHVHSESASAAALSASSATSPPPSAAAASAGADLQGKPRSGNTVEYKSGEDTVRAYLAKPAGTQPFPAVILVHEWWGLTEWVKDVADRMMAKGYVALALDLYRGAVSNDAEQAHQLMRGLPQDRAIRDLHAAVAYLEANPSIDRKHIGVIGWCMGGGFALQACIHVPDVAGCVVNYGGLVDDEQLIRQIHAPLLINVGADDKWPDPKDVKQFAERAKKQKKAVQTFVYPGVGHAFMNATNKKAYNPERAAEAWQHIDSFFERTLKPQEH